MASVKSFQSSTFQKCAGQRRRTRGAHPSSPDVTPTLLRFVVINGKSVTVAPVARIAAVLTLLLASCSAWAGPSADQSTVTREFGGWLFTEAADQSSVTAAVSQREAERLALAHLADQHGAPRDLESREALFRRGLLSIEGYGAGAQEFRRQDAWVLRFSTSSGAVTGWVVVAADGQVLASGYDGPVETPET